MAGFVKIGFCGLGIVAAIILTMVDFTTSWRGIQAVIGPNNQSDLLKWLPFVMAGMALVMNALSSYMLKMYKDKGFTDFSGGFITACWIGFVSYDGASSFIGLLGEFHGQPISGFGQVYKALSGLDGMQVSLCFIVAILATFGPLLVTVFADLLRHIAEDSGIDVSSLLNTGGGSPAPGRRR